MESTLIDIEADGWDHLVNHQLRPEHQKAREVAIDMRRLGVRRNRFVSTPILVFGAECWRDMLSNLPSSFPTTVRDILPVVNDPSAAYIWAVLGHASGYSREETLAMAADSTEWLIIIHYVKARKYPPRIAHQTLLNGIDPALSGMLLAGV